MRARMFDLSQFCKTFKETYTQDYNRRHENSGTIWEGRFKSILLEGNYRTLMTVSGYIHLNPVRANVVDAPEKAQWTAFGDACTSADPAARAGLCAMLSRVYGSKEEPWGRVRAECERVMKGRLREMREEEPAGRSGDAPAAGNAEEVEDRRDATAWKPDGESPPSGETAPGITLFGLLRRRLVGFLNGGALGGEQFIAGLASRLPPRHRRRIKCLFDSCPFLKLGTATGVRDLA